jgi:hypothetical protein
MASCLNIVCDTNDQLATLAKVDREDATLATIDRDNATLIYLNNFDV